MLADETANLRSAVHFCGDTGDGQRLARLIGASGPFLLRDAGGISELDTWVEDALRAEDLTDQDRTAVLFIGAFRSGRPTQRKLECAEQAHALARQMNDDAATATAEYLIGDVMLDGDPEQSETFLRSAIDRAGPLGQFQVVGQAVNSLTNLLLRERRVDEVFGIVDPCLAHADLYGATVQFLHYQRARASMLSGDLAEARRGFQTTMAAVRATGGIVGNGYALFGLALLNEREGDDAEARRLYEQSSVFDIQSGDTREILIGRVKLCEVCTRLNDLDAAREHLTVIRKMIHADPDHRALGYLESSEGLVATLENDLERASAHLLKSLDHFARIRATASILDVLRALQRAHRIRPSQPG